MFSLLQLSTLRKSSMRRSLSPKPTHFPSELVSGAKVFSSHLAGSSPPLIRLVTAYRPEERAFQVRSLNVVDCLQPMNNLGRFDTAVLIANLPFLSFRFIVSLGPTWQVPFCREHEPLPPGPATGNIHTTLYPLSDSPRTS